MKADKTRFQKSLVFALITALALSFALGALFGCAAKEGMEPDDAALRFIELLNGGDYEAAYGLLTAASMEKISEEEFVQKYGGIFSGLSVKEVIIGENSFAQSAMYATFAYTATYRTADYGDITKNYSMSLHLEDGAWRIEWTPSLIFPEMTWGDSVYARVIKAERGEIFASDGTLLAGNIPGSTAFADRSKIEDLSAFCAAAAVTLGMKAEEVQKCFDATTANIVTIKAWRRGELPEETRQSWLSLAGAGVDDSRFTVFRTYPMGEAFFHLVGYVGRVTQEELDDFSGTEKEKLYDGDSYIGKAGLELVYEDVLRGRDGYEVYVSGENGKINIIPTVEAVDGSDLWLTIDARDQQAAYDLLTGYLMDQQGGSIVQIDPTTGAVQVMVSYPSADPNAFVTGVSSEYYNYLLSDTAYQPLFNRCLSGRYPPASIVKPFVALAALEGGAIAKNSVFPFEIKDNKWRPDRSDWVYPAITRVKNRGDSCDLYNSMIYSDNIYFAWAAMELGQEGFFAFFEKKLGWGASVPFDLPVARAQIKKENTEFNIKYLADSGYGQGEMLITPFQAALLYCTLSNPDGAIYKPYVVEQRCSAQGEKYLVEQCAAPELWMRVQYDSSARDAIEQSLTDVTVVGTARTLRPPFEMAGKTGTAEIGNEKDREIGWLAIYRNEEPKDTVLVVTLDTPEGYSEVKLPIARYLLRREVRTDESDATIIAAD
ncbi:MAG: penicillin-binding transpeptidase domain-containing protein [Christensenellales bacterium]|jgi:cell division protein FtsI/penicillin-binding protein 2